ncbi:5-oxoprolinase subunit PxpB [Paenibacillus sp. FJAT-26967]|uniref:5-oxoprolinase subunit PxpB n=1 Tax=Paenibacillus sp. FJAT-26967 TaxID=1729690 RepID=UPI000837B91B|nr:5-oxoprolinase subunit PxpB [Paenibacillus sp. FJAT-26967]
MGTFPKFLLEPLGDQALLIRFGESFSEELSRQVLAAESVLTRNPFPGLVETVPAYHTLTIWYSVPEVHAAQSAELARNVGNGLFHQEVTVFEWVSGQVEKLLTPDLLEKNYPEASIGAAAGRVKIIPVCYGGEYGPDLEEVAKIHGLTAEEVIRLHSGACYRVYMIGFIPGFPYMGGLPSALATPRRSNPRVRIPAGSVGIGGTQTGVYPLASPGGWHLIGRTPYELFTPRRDIPALLQAGDDVRFQPITAADYERIRRTL